jgi:hypothetical protein
VHNMPIRENYPILQVCPQGTAWYSAIQFQPIPRMGVMLLGRARSLDDASGAIDNFYSELWNLNSLGFTRIL